MDYLTLVIAIGGIATGVGAIGTVIVARRQLTEQRQFLQEQTDIARRQAKITETTLKEENERARVNLEVDIMYKSWEQWSSPTYEEYRRQSVQYFMRNFVIDGRLVEPDSMDASTRKIFEYYDELGYLTRTGVLRFERVWNSYSGGIRLGWAWWEPAVKRLRGEWNEPHWCENFEYLYDRTLEFDRARGRTGAPPTSEEVRHFVEEAAELFLVDPEPHSPNHLSVDDERPRRERPGP